MNFYILCPDKDWFMLLLKYFQNHNITWCTEKDIMVVGRGIWEKFIVNRDEKEIIVRYDCEANSISWLWTHQTKSEEVPDGYNPDDLITAEYYVKELGGPIL